MICVLTESQKQPVNWILSLFEGIPAALDWGNPYSLMRKSSLLGFRVKTNKLGHIDQKG